ncbi:DEKNAAC101107 [Brettanomyces naardenensis]|uniref:DEKNAAC101107 n=1 Tax=Brettanomyces naardenensis TaxID=13370 RepID=A0A448YHF5_BRENA|nr:DEKNAAC101107 [Brettanomyces naardenensis]
MTLVTISDSIKDSLTKSEVIPTVIHDKSFTPKGFLTIKYDTDKEVAMGNTIKPADSQNRPRIDFTLNLPSDSSTELKISKDDKFTLVVTDPDAPTKGDEKWSEFCHYLSINVQLNVFDSEKPDNSSSAGSQLTTTDIKGVDLLPYIGPGPPPKTGKHRYVFLLYRQSPGFVPISPEGRPTWGTGVPGSGAAEYAEKYHLTLFAVNFFYAQNLVQ